jgi:hypothetical protein
MDFDGSSERSLFRRSYIRTGAEAVRGLFARSLHRFLAVKDYSVARFGRIDRNSQGYRCALRWCTTDARKIHRDGWCQGNRNRSDTSCSSTTALSLVDVLFSLAGIPTSRLLSAMS